jgi:Lysozyme like domain/D-alanyl-D-alanine carboxypeptidase
MRKTDNEGLAGASGRPLSGPQWEGLNVDFRSRLQQLINASNGRVFFVSGFRTEEHQAELFRAAVKKYGSEKAARKWVAPPGKSHHNHGMAADLGGDLTLAHRLAPTFGLKFPMPWEKWHIEPVEQAENADAQTTPPDGQQPIDKFSQNASHLASLFGVDITLPDTQPEQVNTGTPHPVGGRVQQIASAAKAAGFTGQGLVTAIAVALAEGGNAGARNTNKDKSRSVDRGWWQFNSKWHPEVSDAEADDVMSAAKHAFRVSGGGASWSPWSTYKNGAYKNYLGDARAAVGMAA